MMDFIYSIVGFFATGGLFMYPILLVFTVGMAIAVERWIQLSRTRNENRKVWGQLQPFLVKGELVLPPDMGQEEVESAFSGAGAQAGASNSSARASIGRPPQRPRLQAGSATGPSRRALTYIGMVTAAMTMAVSPAASWRRSRKPMAPTYSSSSDGSSSSSSSSRTSTTTSNSRCPLGSSTRRVMCSCS